MSRMVNTIISALFLTSAIGASAQDKERDTQVSSPTSTGTMEVAMIQPNEAAILPLVRLPSLGLSKAKKYEPKIDPANFTAGVVDNPFFPLRPGTVFHYAEKNRNKVNDNEVTVTKATKVILGVTCVVVHDTLKDKKGTLIEDTLDWYAQDRDGNVWYFGEDTKEYDDKGNAHTKGSWEAGVKGAQPGIIMPAHAKAGGAKYRQEYLKGEAEDNGQVVATNDKVNVPAGKYTGCIRTKEWSDLESGSEKKWYAKGIGFVRSESKDGGVVELVSVTN